jgi:hypothetical protein
MLGLGLKSNNLGIPKFCCELGNFLSGTANIYRVMIPVRIRLD